MRDIFSSDEPKVQVSFSDQNVSVVGGRRCRRRKLFFYIFIFFSRTTGPISTKLSTNHTWLTGIQVLFKWKVPPFSKGR